jgi:hypothetical protein
MVGIPTRTARAGGHALLVSSVVPVVHDSVIRWGRAKPGAVAAHGGHNGNDVW